MNPKPWAKLGLLMTLALAVSARAWVPVPPVGEHVEVRVGDSLEWVPAADRRVDSILVQLHAAPLGIETAVPPGYALARRDAGWAIEPATYPALEGAPVDLNKASAASLQSLPGVGPATAAAIVAARPYRSTAELTRAKGVGPALLARLEGQVWVHAGVPPEPAIRLNCADQSELESLPRIGPALAVRLMAARPFDTPGDLERVRGIGPATVAVLAPLVDVGDCP